MVQIMALSNDEAVPMDNSIQNLFQPDLYYEVGQQAHAKLQKVSLFSDLPTDLELLSDIS